MNPPNNLRLYGTVGASVWTVTFAWARFVLASSVAPYPGPAKPSQSPPSNGIRVPTVFFAERPNPVPYETVVGRTRPRGVSCPSRTCSATMNPVGRGSGRAGSWWTGRRLGRSLALPDQRSWRAAWSPRTCSGTLNQRYRGRGRPRPGSWRAERSAAALRLRRDWTVFIVRGWWEAKQGGDPLEIRARPR